MKICPACFTENADDNIYCNKCRNDIRYVVRAEKAHKEMKKEDVQVNPSNVQKVIENSSSETNFTKAKETYGIFYDFLTDASTSLNIPYETLKKAKKNVRLQNILNPIFLFVLLYIVLVSLTVLGSKVLVFIALFSFCPYSFILLTNGQQSNRHFREEAILPNKYIVQIIEIAVIIALEIVAIILLYEGYIKAYSLYYSNMDTDTNVTILAINVALNIILLIINIVLPSLNPLNKMIKEDYSRINLKENLKSDKIKLIESKKYTIFKYIVFSLVHLAVIGFFVYDAIDSIYEIERYFIVVLCGILVILSIGGMVQTGLINSDLSKHQNIINLPTFRRCNKCRLDLLPDETTCPYCSSDTELLTQFGNNVNTQTVHSSNTVYQPQRSYQPQSKERKPKSPFKKFIYFIANVIWFLTGGLGGAVYNFLMGVFYCITLIFIPLGKQSFKFAKLTLSPFGKKVNLNFSKHAFLNILWIIFGGFVSAVFYFFVGVFSCITIIGIPSGLQAFKMAKLSFAPFGATITKDN